MQYIQAWNQYLKKRVSLMGELELLAHQIYTLCQNDIEVNIMESFLDKMINTTGYPVPGYQIHNLIEEMKTLVFGEHSLKLRKILSKSIVLKDKREKLLSEGIVLLLQSLEDAPTYQQTTSTMTKEVIQDQADRIRVYYTNQCLQTVSNYLHIEKTGLFK